MSGFIFLLALLLPGAPPKAPPIAIERQTWQTENGLPQNTVHALLQTADGFLWAATEGGIARFDGVQFRVFSTETEPQMQSNDVRALAEGAAGEVWAATAGGLVRIRGSEVRNFSTGDGLPNANILSVGHTAAGELIGVTSSGPAQWNGQRFVTMATAPLLVPTPPDLELNPGDPLLQSVILCRLRDREGNIWIGTETEGLTTLRRAKFAVYTTRQGLSGDDVRCIFETRDGVLWIGTSEHGLTRFSEDHLTTFTTEQGLSSNVIIALGEDSDGTLLVGTPDGLNRLRNGKVSVLTSADGLADDFIRSVVSTPSTLYIGTRRGLTRIEGDRIQTLTKADGLGSNLVGALLTTSDGMLWMATLGGLTRLDHGVIRNFTTADGLTSDVITALHPDRDGNLWIGTQGGSLLCYRNGHFLHFSPAAGLPQTIFGLVEDEHGNLWLAAKSGVFRVDRQALLDGRGEAVAYGTSDGLRVNECSGGGHPAVWKTRDGTLWFATPRGLAAMSPSQAEVNRVPPPTAIESVAIDDQAIDPRQLTAVPPGHRRFAFAYAGLSFVAPQKVRYRYKLEGFDRDWVDAGVRRTAYYTNLPPGSYRFRVIARNNDGFWSDRGASLDLKLEPHVYQRNWFLVLCFLLLAAAIYSAYRLRVRQVAARYDAVLAERNRIAREIHDTLAQGFAGVSVQLEILSRLLGSPSDAVRQHLREARELVRESLAEARRSIWQLRSQSGAPDDLASRLGKLTRESSTGGDTRITFEVQGAFRPLDHRVEDELFRIAEEALRNAFRHGRATQVGITLAFGRRIVKLTVADNGHGFDLAVTPRSSDGHFGLDGMSERAGQIGGRFAIESAPGQGTSVAVEVPVK